MDQNVSAGGLKRLHKVSMDKDGTGGPEKQRGPQFATIASVAGRNDFFCARQIMKEGVTLVYLPYV